jgi:hypothetical protein
LMWIESATPATLAIPATLATQTSTIHYSLPTLIPLKNSLARFIPISVLWNIFMTECILFIVAAF